MVLKTSPSLICRSGSRIGHRIPSRIPLSSLRRRYRSHVWAAPSHHSSREGSQTAQGRCDTPRSWNENVTSTSSCSSTSDAVEEQCTESKHHFFQHGITFQNSKAENKAIAEGGVFKMYPSNIEKVSLHVICMSLQDLKITWSWPGWFALVAWRWFFPPSDKRQPLHTWQSSTWHMFLYHCFLCAINHVRFISLSPRLPLSKMASHGTNQTSWTGNFGYVK